MISHSLGAENIQYDYGNCVVVDAASPRDRQERLAAKEILREIHVESLMRNENASLDVYRGSQLAQVIVMSLKISASLAFAAACLTAVGAMPAHANTPSARQNVIHSDHYTRMLETNRAFRQARMRKECGPVTDPELHQQCLASFQQYSPMVASAASPRKVASSRHH